MKRKSVNLTAKDTLARLMAGEDIYVKHGESKQASFDVKNRVLNLPTLKEDTPGLMYTGFIGHEIGHALYSPVDWYEISKKEKLPTSVVNIVEDARIERKVKYEYPGMKKVFNNLYKELHENQDLFKVEKIGLETRSFIDKINLHFKLGSLLDIDFTPEETKIVEKVANTKTFEDVIAVSKEIVEQTENEDDDQQDDAEKQDDSKDNTSNDGSTDDKENDSTSDNEQGDQENDDEKSGDDTGSQNNEEADNDQQDDGEESDEKNNSTSDSEEQQPSDTNETQGDNDKFESISYDAMSSQFEDALETDKSKLQDEILVIVPEVKKVEDVILTPKMIYKYGVSVKEYDKSYAEFYKENKPIVNFLVNQFNMKKSAEDFKRTLESKTGKLDASKLFKYKYSDDIFLRSTSTKDAKNHGLIMFLDWSGSMDDILHDTMKQLIVLMMFCRKVNIPFEVYSFMNNQNNIKINVKHDNEFNMKIDSGFRLGNLISSNMKTAEFDKMCKYMFAMSDNVNRYSKQNLSMTPLDEAILMTSSIVDMFKDRYNVQKINIVYLTDGQSTTTFKTEHDSIVSDRYLKLIDAKTKKSQRCNTDNASTSMFNILKDRVDVKVAGFFLASDYQDFYNFLDWVSCGTKSDTELTRQNELINKKGVGILENIGYDQLYIIKDLSLNSKYATMNHSTKYNNKVKSRIFLNKFIELIS